MALVYFVGIRARPTREIRGSGGGSNGGVAL